MANLSSYISTSTPASLNDLSDLSTSGASAGEVLSVNSDGTFSFIAIGGGTTSYNTIGDLPLVDNDTGDTAFVTANNKLYVWNGSGWYSIATVNETPTWDSGSAPESTYAVPNDGSSLTIILAASDPEGFPITYTAVTDSEFDAFAEITQNSDESFTVTMLSSASVAATGTVTFRASDGVNILSNVSTFSITFITTVENSNYTSLLLTSVGSNGGTNSTVTDSSTNNHTITVNGNASSQTFSPYREGGYSYYFDGSGDYLRVSGGTGAVDTSTFTIGFWYYPTTSSVIGLFDSGSGQSNVFRNYPANTISDQNNSNDRSVSFSSNINEWNWMCVVKNGTSFEVFVNDVSQGTNSAQANQVETDFDIGVINSGSAGSFQGYIADFVVNDNASQISAPSERPSVTLNTALLTCHLPYIVDDSSNDHSITVNGNVSAKPFAPYDYSEYDSATNGGSILFDASGDKLTYSPGSTTSFGTGDFTIECWFYRTGIPGNGYHDIIFSNRASGGSNPSGSFGLYVEPSDGSPFGWQNTTGSTNNLTGGACYLNRWYHIAIVRSGTTLTLYVNGTSVNSRTMSDSIGNTNTCCVGAFVDGSYRSNGYVTDLRVVNGTAVYTSNFTPPTEPLTAITNTSLLVSSTDASIIDKSQSVPLTLYGNTQSSTSQTKYASSSIYFDGSGDYIRADDAVEGIASGVPFTFESWVYPVTIGGTGTGTTDFLGLNAHSNGANILTISPTQFRWNGTDDTALPDLSANQWQHVAFVYDGSTAKYYVDGTLTYTLSGSMSVAAKDCSVAIGCELDGSYSPGNYFYGYMEDVRFTKGLARYTANFTPPSASLEA